MATSAPAGSGHAVRGDLALVPIAAALILSASSWLGACPEGCAETDQYRLFGIALPPFGVAYFALCGVALLARRRSAYVGAGAALLLSGALGSEVVLVWIQKFVIGRWCPLCVGIALSVVTACALLAWEKAPDVAAKIRSGERTHVMKRLAGRTALVFIAFLAGVTVSALGMKKPDALAAGFSADSLAFGRIGSSSEVYIVTDWFCPACRKSEPEIVKGARLAMEKAQVVFVDYPIHRETLNYMPYNLSFMVREKERYLPIREALAALALKTKEPTPEEIQAAVSPLGVKFVPLNHADVMAGMEYFQSVIRKLQVSATPVVVVRDSRTGKAKTLRGVSGITADAMLKAVSDIAAE